MPEGEREELFCNVDRLICRCLTVDITVHTARSHTQEDAQDKIKQLISHLDKLLEKEYDSTGQRMLISYLNASLPEEAVGPTDQKFQETLLQCAADDQKKFRQLLQARADQFLPPSESDTFLSCVSQQNGCNRSTNNGL